MPRKPANVDPLIAAMIARLPAPGTEFSEDRQRAWLRMMAMAFSTVYGGDVASDQPAASKSSAPAKPAPPPPPSQFPFMVDPQGYAISAKGKRIMPAEVNGSVLYDMRGEADIGAIIWADDSTGVIGFAGEISAVMQ